MDDAPKIAMNNLLTWEGTPPVSVATREEEWLEAEWLIEKGCEFSTTCRMALPAMAKPFWCIPGLFWGDNQQDTTGQYYPRFQARLKCPEKFQSRSWEFHAWRAAQPLVAVSDGTAWWILEVECSTSPGKVCPSIGFEYEEGCPVLVASLPARERPYRPVGHDYTMPSEPKARWESSTRIRWRVRAQYVPGGHSQIFACLRENYHRQKTRGSRESLKHYAQAARNALLKWHYQPEKRSFRYTVAFDRVGQQLAEAQGASLDRQEMALGWVSGWVVFEALVEWGARTGDTLALEAVNQCWQNLMEAGLVSPSGFWWTRYAPPSGRTASIFESSLPGGMDGNWMPDPYHLHMRTLGDAVWRAARTLRLHGSLLPFAGSLRTEVLRQARKVAELARSGWPLPLSLDARTGKPAGLRGTAGMIWISVWRELAAQGLWEDQDVIREGLHHYRKAVESGQLYGAPEDVGECMTSEDIYIAINTYLDGFRATGQREDLDTCLQAAQWLYLWRKSFQHDFDPRTLIGTYGLKSRGGDLASFKNNHLHIYGLDAEESLLELTKQTGDRRWKILADDHWAFAAQLTPLTDGQFNAYEGMVTEQFYFIDWSALGNSVRLFEEDSRSAAYDVGPHYRNYGNLAGFSHAWCTAFVLRSALRRMQR